MSVDKKLFENENYFPSDSFKLPIGEIRQVSELSLIKGSEMAEHTQGCDELTYAVSGKAKIYSNNECQEMCGGQIHFIRKGAKHRIVVDNNENFRYICIGIIPDRSYKDINRFFNNVDVDSFFVADDGNIRIFSEMLINEIYFKDEDSEIMINSYLTQIFITLARLLNNNKNIWRCTNCNHGPKQYVMYHMLRYIDREYLNIKSVKQIAEKMAYSEYYLSHLFKEKMDISIKEYLIRKKIHASQELLISTNLKIEEIATQLNFGGYHTFNQAFKRIVSMSPSDYRKNSKF